ncbi:universal stress protein [Pontibacter sp. SGAir0037]|uniref:universal stress protein n=1 Tax=Pontibacter sp. SGAir0037 TaxID=2571030 RepID=UPI0010CD14EC|nr:universal stress protein [Pontibacter sp. SGAir0037]QCR21243.1 hypothetical protein C1N53_02010 [Pontibacter sp. SGAir0037]
MKKIIIPTDLTLHSLNLIKYALHLLKGETCQILLVHLIPLPDSITELLMLPRDENRLEKPTESFTKALERLQKSYAIEINSIRVSHVYCDSSLHLQNFIVRNKVELVLCPVPIGKVSADDTMQLFNNLVQDVSCPVLYVPEFFEINRFKKIAFVVDPDDHQSALPDKKLVSLLCKNDYHVTFLVVFKPGTDLENLKPVFDKVYSSQVFSTMSCSIHLLQEDNLTTGVISFIDQFEVDLLVTCKKKSLLDYLPIRKNRRLSQKAIHSKVPYLALK